DLFFLIYLQQSTPRKCPNSFSLKATAQPVFSFISHRSFKAHYLEAHLISPCPFVSSCLFRVNNPM
ncbi:hypothetical protein TorRG33x02_354370, partial [Trema orientale]